MITTDEMETPAASRPFGLLLDEPGMSAYAKFFYAEQNWEDVVSRLKNAPRYSNGTLRPQLWFRTKRDALHIRDIILIGSGGLHAELRHR
jgi:hypothetical protein